MHHSFEQENNCGCWPEATARQKHSSIVPASRPTVYRQNADIISKLLYPQAPEAHSVTPPN
ncbi:MAG: hypothetical protein IPI17_15940 [Nitrosomonas sp.]|nr:hypothetical protein [Nitrosomonas sp.]